VRRIHARGRLFQLVAGVIKLLDKAALVSVARYGDHPIAFLVGAPLSGDTGGGVPGVASMLDLVREEVSTRATLELSRYDAEMAGKSGGDAYQAAMQWLQGNLGQGAVNRVIETAVLKARKPGTDANFAHNGEAGDWYIPAGIRQLAQLVCRDMKEPLNRFPGPILTTNFDPLLSLAIELYGARAFWRVVQADGKLADVRESGGVEVIHLHGFWRGSDTLHTAAQLTSTRPQLRESLRRILRQKTLIVVAYGGWDDVFTRTLAEVAADDDAQLNVLWCFRESDVATVEATYKGLFERVAPAIIRGRFIGYGGIECQSIFGAIADASSSAPGAAEATRSPLAGWELIDAAYLGGLSPLRPEEVIRYFDGAIPTWRHAICADIPNRAAVEETVRRLAAIRSSKEDCSLQLIRAAGGEGKSTLLLQAAAAAATSRDWNVLWRPASRTRLPPELVAMLDPAKKWLIVADDAENLVRDITEAARLLHETGRSHIHFLLAARDTDWRYFRGDQQPWATWLNRQPDILLRDLREDDAKVLVTAWRKYGSQGLRDLAALPNLDKQVAAFLDAVHVSTAAPDEGSFFGGLLAVRFGRDGLRNHVVSLLTSLKEEKIEKSDHSLFDALVYVAAVHSVGISGLDENVLADLVGVPRDWVQTLVVNPLGEEAAAVRSAGLVLTRHRNVATAILVASEHDIGVDVAEVWSAVVRQTARTRRDIRIGETFARILHSGPRLQRELPHQFTEQRRKTIAVAAAKSAAIHQSIWLGCIVDLGKTYRIAGDFEAAARVFRDNLAAAEGKGDNAEVIRGYWYEWGVSEGSFLDAQSHRAADAWIQGLSLSDHLSPVQVTKYDAKVACAGLGLAFGKLAQPRSDCPFAHARRAVAYLGRLTSPDPKTLGYFNGHDRESDRIGTSRPRTVNEAIDWLTTGVAQAGRELQDPFLKALLRPEQVSFTILQRVFNAATPSPAPFRKYTKSSAGKGLVDTAITGLPTTPDDLLREERHRTREAIETVARKAWEAASVEGLAEERLRRAKHEALRLIAKLSPNVRRKVSHYFTSQKWLPLIAREPKS
jgi:hypothetical protein